MPIIPLKAAQSITELFILCGKYQVNFLLAASSKKIFATSTIGIKLIQATAALKKKTDQNINLPFLLCLGSGSGTSLFIDLNISKFKKSFAIGISITSAKTILINVSSSFQCQI